MRARILIAEDDTTSRTLLASALTNAGYAATEAPDGESALALLPEGEFDLILTDIRMRRVDGLHVLAAARAMARPPAVILLTGYGSLESAVAALRHGAADYLLKPTELPNLLAAVERALQRRAAELEPRDALNQIARQIAQLTMPANGMAAPPPPTPSHLRIGRLTLDQQHFAASFDGQPLHLTPIEFALLCCLTEAGGRVVTYNEIVRRTHGYQVSDDEAQDLLRSHVHNLRRKIDPAVIVGVRGIGYRISDPAEESGAGAR